MPLKAENEHIHIQASQCTARLQNGDAHHGVKIDHQTLPRWVVCEGSRAEGDLKQRLPRGWESHSQGGSRDRLANS